MLSFLYRFVKKCLFRKDLFNAEVINNLKFESKIGNQATVKLCLNIKGIEVSKFPPLFLIEIYNINDNKDYLPFIHSQDFNFETSQNVILSINSDDNNIKENNKYILNPTFTLFSDYCFTNSKHREKIEKSISLSNLDNNKLIFNWNSKFDTLKISFAEQLSPSSDYQLFMSDIDDLDNLIINPFEPLSFSTTDLLYSYTVLHKQENLNGSYSTIDTEKYEAKLGNEVAPNVKTYEGFVSPSIQSITISSGTNTIVYNYSRAKYTVVLNKGTGISKVSGNGSYKFGVNVIASFTLLDGYQFDSWVGDYSVSSFTIPAKNVTMSAKAKPINYNIAYDLNGGTLEKSNPATYNVTSATITLNNPIKTGYEFIGWTGSNGNKPQISLSIVDGSTGERSYIANYIPISYSITYTLNDGNVTTANPKNYDITSATITLNNPTKTNYDFLGWEGTGIPSGTASLTVTIPQGSTGARSYVASWTLASVLTFDLSQGVTLEMRRCPAGKFNMGSERTGSDNHTVYLEREKPMHEVTLTKDFFIGTYEVTQLQYQTITGNNPSSYNSFSDSPNMPVESVYWSDAISFCGILNTQLASQMPEGYHFDLPTEAQWEYACRAGTNTDFNNGTNMTDIGASSDSNLDLLGWYPYNWGNTEHKPHTVGALASNSFGLYDMHGNVCEWCRDWYSGNFYQLCVDYSNEEGYGINPINNDNSQSENRSVRGGSFADGPINCRSSFRIYYRNDVWSNAVGFRVALVKD